jgi:hypothetical protein
MDAGLCRKESSARVQGSHVKLRVRVTGSAPSGAPPRGIRAARRGCSLASGRAEGRACASPQPPGERRDETGARPTPASPPDPLSTLYRHLPKERGGTAELHCETRLPPSLPGPALPPSTRARLGLPAALRLRAGSPRAPCEPRAKGPTGRPTRRQRHELVCSVSSPPQK